MKKDCGVGYTQTVHRRCRCPTLSLHAEQRLAEPFDGIPRTIGSWRRPVLVIQGRAAACRSRVEHMPVIARERCAPLLPLAVNLWAALTTRPQSSVARDRPTCDTVCVLVGRPFGLPSCSALRGAIGYTGAWSGFRARDLATEHKRESREFWQVMTRRL